MPRGAVNLRLGAARHDWSLRSIGQSRPENLC
jgi:hypothetical protein